MPLSKGSAAAGTGFAGDLVAAILLELSALDDFDEAEARKGLEPLCNGIAEGIITHLEANATLKLSGVTSGSDSVTVSSPNAIT